MQKLKQQAVQGVVEFEVELEDRLVVVQQEDVMPLAIPVVDEAVGIIEVVGTEPATVLKVIVVVVVVVVTPTGRIG
jgi:hypothetical protein